MDLVARLRRLGTTPSARVPPAPWAALFAAYRRDDLDTVLRDAGPAFADLAARPGGEEWVAGPPLLAGAVLAARERFVPATLALGDGLTRLPGTAVASQLGDGDWYALALVEVLTLRGALAEAGAWTDHLLAAGPGLEVRLGATRAAVHLRVARGDLEGAHHLTNAAADLAARARSHLAATLVETDRAVIAAARGSHAWGARTVLDSAHLLLGGGRAPQALLAAAQAGTVGLAVARASAEVGDTISASAMADVARRGADITGRGVGHVQALLATAAEARALGDVARAEACALAATAQANELGAEPLAALGLTEQADLARAVGLWATAAPLRARALDELWRLGLTLEADRFARRHGVTPGRAPSGR